METNKDQLDDLTRQLSKFSFAECLERYCHKKKPLKQRLEELEARVEELEKTLMQQS